MRKLAEHVGGRVELVSEVGQGARFFLDFPTLKPAAAPAVRA